ncbi:Type II secretory pathway ATPase PulE/Tfp pilus assembly pathway [Rubrobacter radiotolerans]|uniref:Type II secretory pathway ATPase PulE/Tfp pilus assembly pathway n=1 Tax=Rubrobacter radiotolerans TaxID=42256 RepID=A0A023X5J9_RUBRA|nr:Type II secretory pathway ATPase PulE/Tfp pilus assembly pathway [Rubrobacter radiotolerans]SMC06545.1 type IV pilus assembly protein PilB [Rubrobacter radiotolerans DSM 5868]
MSVHGPEGPPRPVPAGRDTRASGPSLGRTAYSGRILHALLRRGVLDADGLREARGGLDILSRLVSEGVVGERDLAAARAEVSGLAYVEEPAPVAPEVLAGLVSERKLRRHGAVPTAKDGAGAWTVAVRDPSDLYALEDLRHILGASTEFVVAPESRILAALDRLFAEGRPSRPSRAGLEGENLAVTPVFDELLRRAVFERASDVHLEPSPERLLVRFRVDGVLRESRSLPATLARGLLTRVKVLANLDIAERRLPQDGRFTAETLSGRVDLRVATLPTEHGESAVLRLLDSERLDLDLATLGFLPGDLAAYREVFERPYGTILVTGPTGSGKSTTLYAALAELNSSEKKIVSIEDPVEYRLGGVTQVQVNPRAGLTFASGLRSVLRADPDVIMVGEIRDRETARTAIEAALTGHLVLATLHTNDAPSALARLTDMGVEPYLSASAITCVIAQRLARRLCAACKRPAAPLRGPALSHLPEGSYFVPGGCPACGGTGYRGRIGVYELLRVTDRISSLVVSRASSREIGAVAEADGMRRLRQDGLLKAASGETSVEEVLRTTV